MARKYETSINLSLNELQNYKVHLLASDPVSPVVGQMWYNTTSNLLKYYDGVVRVFATTAGSSGVATFSVDDSTIEDIGTASDPDIRVKALGITNAHISATAAIALSKLATDPLARANHTGTQLANTVSDFDTAVRTNRLDQMAAPTAAVSMNSQQITNLLDPTADQHAATQAYVLARIAALVDTAPGTLDTLNELAAALGDDPNFATTLASQIGALDTRIDALETPPTARKYTTDIGDAAATAIVVTHNLNSRAVVVSVARSTTPWEEVYPDVEKTSVNTITLRFATAPTLNQFTVTVVG